MGKFPRHHTFYRDPNIPEHCQQLSQKSYRPGFDRGHLVPANHVDYSKLAIAQSNYMTNILLQSTSLNKRASYGSELLTECYRDIEDLYIIGGVIPGHSQRFLILNY